MNTRIKNNLIAFFILLLGVAFLIFVVYVNNNEYRENKNCLLNCANKCQPYQILECTPTTIVCYTAICDEYKVYKVK